MMEMLYSTGMRVGELCKLKVGDVDFGEALVRINRGKGAKDRIVPLGSVASVRVDRYLAKGRSTFLGEHADSGYLFVSKRTGGHLSTTTVCQITANVAREAGLEKRVTPHPAR